MFFLQLLLFQTGGKSKPMSTKLCRLHCINLHRLSASLPLAKKRVSVLNLIKTNKIQLEK